MDIAYCNVNCGMQISGMQTFTEIIAAWKDDAKFAEDVGTTRGLVAVWKHRNSIPAAYWNAVIASAARRELPGITLELLTSLTRSRRAIETEAA